MGCLVNDKGPNNIPMLPLTQSKLPQRWPLPEWEYHCRAAPGWFTRAGYPGARRCTIGSLVPGECSVSD